MGWNAEVGLECGVLQYQLRMQAEEAVKYSSKFSNRSRQSQPSSCRSLERNSWSSRDHSLTKNHCLLEVMSLEGSRKSDLYEKILAEGAPAPLKPKPAKNEFNPFRTCFKVESKPEQRFSYEEQEDISHICLCYLACKGETCPCSLNLEEDCTEGYCCKQCIENKRQRREGVMQSEGEADPLELTKVSCTCKRTKCNKKYCSCFAAGVKCGRDCTCEDCANCERQASMEVEPVCIVDEEIRQLPMPESMDFEPFQFRYSYNN